LIYEFISLPLSFHPATALVKRRIGETREISCDELVTEKLLDAAVYARSLVLLAGSAVNMSRPGATITVGIADADILEERVMTILGRRKINARRRNLLLVAAALVFVVPCVAAAPFAFRIGVDPQSHAVSPDGAVVSPHASVVTVQQDDGRKAKQEERATEEQRQRLRELREETLKRKAAELEAQRLEERQLQDASSTQEQEEKKKLREAEEKLRAEREAKERDPELMARRKLEREIMARRQAELAKKANITMRQAIQIAMSQQAGTVMECRLIGERPAGEKDQVFYILTIVSGDEQESASTRMLINAVDGRVVKTWKDEK
jgi:uncharacterized membrane protein YkoI